MEDFERTNKTRYNVAFFALLIMVGVLVVTTIIVNIHVLTASNNHDVQSKTYEEYMALVDFGHFADMQMVDEVLQNNKVNIGDTPHIAYWLKDDSAVIVQFDDSPNMLFVISTDGQFQVITDDMKTINEVK